MPRLLSLDVLRGLTIAAMAMVDNPGSSAPRRLAWLDVAERNQESSSWFE